MLDNQGRGREAKVRKHYQNKILGLTYIFSHTYNCSFHCYRASHLPVVCT